MTVSLSLLALVLSFPPPPAPNMPEAEPLHAPRLDREPGEIYPFTLTDSRGKTVTLDDLDGKVWVASFVIVRCPDGKCPQVTRTMARLQKELANRPDVRLVTFTVDPKEDPSDLERYAKSHEANPARWLFLQGNEEEIHTLLKSFKLRGPANNPGDLDHSQKLVVVNKRGNIRGYYDGLPVADFEDRFEDNLRKLTLAVDKARVEDRSLFPDVNAILNAIASLLILVGWMTIRARLIRLHMLCMLAALVVSAIFLASYLYYHLVVKAGVATRFRDMAPDAPEWVAYTYGGILLSHTLLAVIATPMALVSAYLALADKLRGHVRLARWTMPIWLYVSVTGVVVYWMLYRLYVPG